MRAGAKYIKYTRNTDIEMSDVDPLDVDFIQPVQTVNASTADGFEKLVLPPGHKDIVRALVKTHAKKQGVGEAKSSNNMQREFDIVKGKGKGLIILLHGAPGTYLRGCIPRFRSFRTILTFQRRGKDIYC